MININIRNVETLLEYLESEQERPYHNSFLDLEEPEILSDAEYKRIQFKKYAYPIIKMDDSF